MLIRTSLVAAASAIALLVAPGCAVIRDQSSVGQYIDDTTITTQVKAKFAQDPTVNAMSVSVETLNGTVQLSGFAKTNAERSVAERIARGVEGVKAVRNDIIVRS